MSGVVLGYEIGTGAEIKIPLHHTIVTGTTQLSGKTTTLEGLINRAGKRAIMFRTKRGEADFDYANLHAPFYRERADWQYVQSLLEATMRERLKFERSWIIRATKGTTDLAGVHENVCRELEKAKGLSESVYTNLKAYLDIVLPQLGRINFARNVALEHGLNVMDLVGLTEEVQGLVIASTLEYIHKHERNVISVVPEAWKFIPQGRNTPVHVVIEKLAREGAVIGNFVFLDSQDIAGVDKPVLKNFDVWILGRQREINEIERTLAQIPQPKKVKPKPEEVAQLRVGEFFACYEDQVRRVYVQPAWLPDHEARLAAKTNYQHGRVDMFRPKDKPIVESEDMNRIADLERENSELKERIKILEGRTAVDFASLSKERQREVLDKASIDSPAGRVVQAGPINIDTIERDVSIQFSKEPRVFATTGPKGMIMYVLSHDLKNSPSSEGQIADTMREHGWNYGHGIMAPELAKLVKNGDLIKAGEKPVQYRIPGKLNLTVSK